MKQWSKLQKIGFMVFLLTVLCVTAGNQNVAYAEVFGSYESFKYQEINNGTEVEIMKYFGAGPVVAIPSEIEGKPVTRIGDGAFSKGDLFYGDYLKEVIIPSSVMEIGDNAFSGCWGITKLTIPEGVTRIGDGAFSGCWGITGELVIPEGVTRIGDYTFSCIDGITELTIPSSVTEIGSCAFNGCGGIEELTNPSSVTKIGDGAFSACIGIKELTISSSITEIGSYVFAYCIGLTKVTIPSNVTEIADNAFDGCSNVTFVVSPGSYAEKYAKGKGIPYTFSTASKTTKVSIRLNGQNVKGTLKARVKKSYNFKAVVEPVNVDPKKAKVTWKSSNKKIATVNGKGKVTVKKAGKVTITAKTADGRKASVTLNAVKKAVKVTKLKITGNKTMKVKGKQTLKLNITPVTADNRKVTWKSSNKKVAAVNAKGVVTAKKAGKVTITATAKDDSKKKVTFKVTVKN